MESNQDRLAMWTSLDPDAQLPFSFVLDGAIIAERHPEFVIPDPTTGEATINNLCDLGDQKAREYMTRYLIGAVAEYRLDCLRIDFNQDPLPHGATLRAIDPARSYEVRLSRDTEPAAPAVMRGSELKTLQMVVDECPGSMLMQYRLAG